MLLMLMLVIFFGCVLFVFYDVVDVIDLMLSYDGVFCVVIDFIDVDEIDCMCVGEMLRE